MEACPAANARPHRPEPAPCTRAGSGTSTAWSPKDEEDERDRSGESPGPLQAPWGRRRARAPVHLPHPQHHDQGRPRPPPASAGSIAGTWARASPSRRRFLRFTWTLCSGAASWSSNKHCLRTRPTVAVPTSKTPSPLALSLAAVLDLRQSDEMDLSARRVHCLPPRAAGRRWQGRSRQDYACGCGRTRKSVFCCSLSLQKALSISRHGNTGWHLRKNTINSTVAQYKERSE